MPTVPAGTQQTAPKRPSAELFGKHRWFPRGTPDVYKRQVEHYFEQLDGTYTKADSTSADSGILKFGETKNAADYVRTVENYHYDANHAESVKTISWTSGDAPTGTVLKLYYGIDRYTLTITYVYENGSTAAPTVNREVPVGSDYSVASPIIADYTADIATVAGTDVYKRQAFHGASSCSIPAVDPYRRWKACPGF